MNIFLFESKSKEVLVTGIAHSIPNLKVRVQQTADIANEKKPTIVRCVPHKQKVTGMYKGLENVKSVYNFILRLVNVILRREFYGRYQHFMGNGQSSNLRACPDWQIPVNLIFKKITIYTSTYMKQRYGNFTSLTGGGDFVESEKVPTLRPYVPLHCGSVIVFGMNLRSTTLY